MSTRLAGQWGVPTIALDALLVALVGLTHLLLAQYIRNLDAPVSWDFIWRHSRELTRMKPPDSSEGGTS